MRRIPFLRLALPSLFLAAACGASGPGSTGGTTSSSASSASTSSSVGTGGGTTTGSSGGGTSSTSSTSTTSTGGAGGAGGGMCSAGATQPCYDGPAATKDVGACKSGTQTCAGGQWGPCTGEVLPSAETCNGVDDDCNGAVDEGCAPPWSRGFVGAGTSGVRDMVLDAAGNVYATGGFDSPVDFGGGTLTPKSYVFDGFIVKLSPSGAHLWSMRFGGIYADHGYGIAVDAAGNVYVTGDFDTSADFGGVTLSTANSSDAFVAKLSPAGAVIWVKTFGALYGDAGSSVAVDANGNVAVTGRVSDDNTTHKVDLGGGPRTVHGADDVFVLELDPDGNHLWSAVYGGINYDVGNRVAFDSGGNVIVGGQASLMVDLGGGVLPAGGYNWAFAAKYSPTGAHLWSKSFVGSNGGTNQLASLAVAANDDVLVCGPMSAPVDFGGGPVPNAAPLDVFVARYTPAGAYAWAVNYGDPTGGGCHAISTDAAGNALAAGYLGDLNAQATWLASYTPAGVKAWTKSFPSTGTVHKASVWAAHAAPGGHVAVAGFFQGTLDLGAAGTPMAGLANDGFVGLVVAP